MEKNFKKSGNVGLLNQEFGFSKVYFIYSFYFIKNRQKFTKSRVDCIENKTQKYDLSA